MTDITQPIGNIKPMSQNGYPIPVNTTLVDDPVALVDDPNVLVGSQITATPAMRTTVSANAPVGAIKQFR